MRILLKSIDISCECKPLDTTSKVNMATDTRSLLVLCLCLCAIQTSLCDVIVQTKYGKLQGLSTQFSRAFLGVPYAKPPVDTLRWRSPQDPAPWTGVYNATVTNPGCYQLNCSSMNPSQVCPQKVSEDCLYVNIWTPLDANTTSGYPVMVYLHGGNFVHMSGGSLLFNGEYFSDVGKVILVNVDYRLGAFGYLYTGDGQDDSRGNYGLQDQRKALEWVKENIRNFGGNPEKVTLFGQSAGAQSTLIHMYNGKAKGLFHNVIIESSPFSIRYKTREEALFLGDTIAELANCKGGDTTCLRSKTALEIATAEEQSRTHVTSFYILEFFEPLGPWVDGDEVPMEPVKAARKRLFMDVPIMIGTTTEETRIYIYETWGKPLTFETYAALLLATDPKKCLDIGKEYPPKNISDCRDDLQALSTDFIFTCSTRNVTSYFNSYMTSPQYLYVYDHAFSFQGWGRFAYCEQHVCHGSEIAILFHTASLGGYKMTKDEETLSKQLIYYWSNMAYTSNPSMGPHVVKVQWPSYSPATQPSMHFKTPQNEVINSYRKDYCAFWDTIGYDI